MGSVSFLSRILLVEKKDSELREERSARKRFASTDVGASLGRLNRLFEEDVIDTTGSQTGSDEKALFSLEREIETNYVEACDVRVMMMLYN